MVIVQFTRLGREAKVGNGRQGRGLARLEAELPAALRLVLQLELQELVLEVGQLELGRDGRVAEAARRATRQLVRLAIIGLVVVCLAVADHGHNVREDHAGPVVLVRVEEDAETLELVHATEYRPDLATILRHPKCETVAIEIALPANLELDFDLPIRCRQGNPREKPSGLRLAV